jgi:tetratricopeptide (TPR) repeat protein
VSLLLELFDKLPTRRSVDDDDLWAAGFGPALAAFEAGVRARYTDGTLLRLLDAPDPRARRAAALALGLTAAPAVVPAVAGALHDEDAEVRRFATDALWELWFRGGTEAQNARLRRAAGEPDAEKAKAALDALAREAPEFAEVLNQRAIWHFKRGEYARAALDCEAVLQLNPHHFGAAAGLGQCQMKLNRPRAALRAFRRALAINPDLDLHDTVRALEALDGE